MTGADETKSAVVPRSTGRMLDLLETVLSKGACNLTTAAAVSGLTPTTALRHLRALEARGYIDRDTSGQFSAGPTLLRIAASLHESGPLDRLVTVAKPILRQLVEDTGESTYLAVSDGATATYVATIESSRAIRHVGWIGQNITLDGSAVGAALAHPGTCAIRTGAVEPDITAVSCALPQTGKLGMAISVIGPQHRLGTNERVQIEAALTAATNKLADVLGYTTEAVA